MSIPSDIASYLTPDEEVIKTAKSRDGTEIYVTNKRVILKKGGLFGRHIEEASYRFISSIEYMKKSPWGAIIIGIVLIVLAFIIRLFLNDFFLSILSEVSEGRTKGMDSKSSSSKKQYVPILENDK